MSVKETSETIDVNKFRVNPREHKTLLERAMRMIGLLKDDSNAEGVGDCQILAVCLTFFGPRKCNQTEKSKEIMKSK